MIRWSLLLLPLCGAWIIPPHVENAPVDGIKTSCENFTYENWLVLQVEPHHFNEDAIQFLEEAEEVTDYVEPLDDPDFDPNDSESLDDYYVAERFKRSLDDDEYNDEDGGGTDVPIEGGVDLGTGNSSGIQPITFLKLKQKGRNPRRELLQPHQPALIMLKNYQKAPMSFFVTVSPYSEAEDDEESSAVFYEDLFPMNHPEFAKLSPCWLNHTLAESGICKQRHHRGHRNRHGPPGREDHENDDSGPHDDLGHGEHHHGHGRRGRHHGHSGHGSGGHHSNRGHGHRRRHRGHHGEDNDGHHSVPGDHSSHGDQGHHDLDQEQDDNGFESHGDEGHREPHIHPHDEYDIQYVHYEHEGEHTEEGHTEDPTLTSSNENDVEYGEGVIDLRNVHLEANAGSSEHDEEEEETTSTRKPCKSKKCRKHKVGHVKAEGKGAICPHAFQGWAEGESKAVVEYLTPKGGCFVIRAYVSYPLEEGSMILTSEANEEFLEHFDCVQPNPVPGDEINDYDEDSSEEDLDFESGDSEEENELEDSDEDDSHEEGSYRKRRHSPPQERLGRKLQKARRKHNRQMKRQNRRRNRPDGPMNPNAIHGPRTGNRWLMKNETTPGGKFCCREGILHKKSSTYENEDGSYPTLQCDITPSEVTLWAKHKFDIESDICQSTYTRCCEDFDVEQWQTWVARREARQQRRQNKPKRRGGRRMRGRNRFH